MELNYLRLEGKEKNNQDGIKFQEKLKLKKKIIYSLKLNPVIIAKKMNVDINKNLKLSLLVTKHY